MNEQFINDLSKELAKLGTIHSVGEEWISYTGKIPSGGIPYCGQEVTRETYSALWSWVQAQGLVKTESEWQSIASSQNGNVPFYSSGNGTTTFRIPKLVGYVKGASSQAESGSYVAEGLPNITGKESCNVYMSGRDSSGALTMSNGSTAYTLAGAANTLYKGDLIFNASSSNPIYGNSTHVTPETSVVMFGVYAFGTVSNPSDLNVSSLVSEIDNIKTGYLPLSGGTMTGAITLRKGDNSIVAPTDNGYIEFEGGTEYLKGAKITLYGKDYVNPINSGVSGGHFRLSAMTEEGNAYYHFVGRPDGKLYWRGQDIERVASQSLGSSGYIRYASGLQVCWGHSCYDTQTFPVPFYHTPTITIGHWTRKATGGSAVIAWAGAPSTTGFTVNTVYLSSGDAANTDLDYVAYGDWK